MMSARRLGFLLAIFAFVVFMSNGRVNPGETDTVATRTLPFAILGSGTIYLDPVRDVVLDPYRPDRIWWLQPTRTGGIASTYPIATPILIAPLYVPAVVYLSIQGRTTERLLALSLIMERVAASILSACTALLLYFGLLRLGISIGNALLLAAAFAFGTGAWSINSQQLWLHGAGAFFCAGALFAMAGLNSRSAVIIAGALVSLIVCARPGNLGLAAGLGLAALMWAGSRWWLLIPAVAVPALATLGYNLYGFGNPFGGYGLNAIAPHFQQSTVLHGIAGLLVSPARGLFVFSPFLLLLPFGIAVSLGERREVWTTCALILGLTLHVLTYSITDWRAGWTYGPRFLLDAVPVIVWLVAPALPRLRTIGHAVFACLIAFSIWVQFVGAFQYNSDSDRLIYADEKPWTPVYDKAWQLENAPFLVESRNPRQPANMLTFLRQL